MNEQTEITDKTTITRSEPSAVGNVSIRAWLAVLITITICANWTANMVMASLGVTSTNITIPEPLYSAFMMVLGMYFTQATRNKT